VEWYRNCGFLNSFLDKAKYSFNEKEKKDINLFFQQLRFVKISLFSCNKKRISGVCILLISNNSSKTDWQSLVK
jgi:hypothetical protein